MVLLGKGPSVVDSAAVEKRLAITYHKSGPALLLQNIRVFGIASFACLGGLLYGYNQGVFSGVLTMNNFNAHMGEYTIGTEFLWRALSPHADADSRIKTRPRRAG
jgi:hypothetical protein